MSTKDNNIISNFHNLKIPWNAKALIEELPSSFLGLSQMPLYYEWLDTKLRSDLVYVKHLSNLIPLMVTHGGRRLLWTQRQTE
jgi:hypothetical protein